MNNHVTCHGCVAPKIDADALLHHRRYVITCFLFAFLSVVEYAAVNHFMYKPNPESKVIGRHIDYFFKYSAGPLWILVVALFFLQHQLTQIIMYVFASIWLFAGSIIIMNDVYKATKNRPGCIRLRNVLFTVRLLFFYSLTRDILEIDFFCL